LEKFIRDEIPITNQNELDVIAKYLESRGICDVKSLIQVENWDRIQQDLPAVCNRLKTIVEQRKNSRAGLQTAKTRERTNAEELSDLNKCYRFLLFEAQFQDRLAKMGYLNPDALNEGFNEQANDPEFDGGPVLVEIKQKLEVFTQEKKIFRSTSHGMILYGPPGTGKTHLCTVIIQKFGLFGLVEPLSSSELNRSLVGQTEQLLMAMFHRATYVPYLLCCIAIDEIDALVPKRSEKSAEHKVDVLSLLLSLIGGIKDVPNVFIIASTNRLNKIDDAFARRLQVEIYKRTIHIYNYLNI
jgi:Cdc6-like AAA superfamily ATPase